MNPGNMTILVQLKVTPEALEAFDKKVERVRAGVRNRKISRAEVIRQAMEDYIPQPANNSG
jgi:hypothetical protein